MKKAFLLNLILFLPLTLAPLEKNKNQTAALPEAKVVHAVRSAEPVKVDGLLKTETFGTRYVFGRIDQTVLSSEIRLNWTFTPMLTLQAYLQPFIAVGAYDRFKELARPRVYAYDIYGEGTSAISYSEGRYTVDPDGTGTARSFSFWNPDFNVKSLRGTIVLRWEYHPGSLLYLVWTQNRADYSHPGDLRLGRDLGDLLSAPGDNIFLVKVSYRWNI